MDPKWESGSALDWIYFNAVEASVLPGWDKK